MNQRYGPAVKRLIDMSIAAAALVVLAPLMVLVALTPLFTFGLAIVHRQEQFHVQGLVGAVIAILFVIAFLAILAGIVTAISANEVRKHDGPWGWIAVRAGLNVLIGILLLVWPATGIMALLWLFGLFAVVTGIVFVVRAIEPPDVSAFTDVEVNPPITLADLGVPAAG